MGVRQSVENIPFVGVPAVRLARAIRRRGGQQFRSSDSYWEERYRTGGDSGAGSYNRLAEFKASVLNDFVRDQNVESLLELGCGDGSQLALANYPRYVGSDVSAAAVEMCRSRFAGDTSKTFFLNDELPAGLTVDLTMSLDVVYHLVEDQVFEDHMRSLFGRARRFVVIYASNEDRRLPEAHVRHRRFTDWVAAQQPDWTLRTTIPNAYPFDPEDPENTSFADFYIYERR